MSQTPVRHKRNLDILRALAVSCVIVHHLLLTLHSHLGSGGEGQRHYLAALGHAGVLAFFVHTSLVLMYSLERMHAGGGPVTAAFYIRRAFRIYPLAITAILIAVTLHIPYKVWDQPEPVSRAAVVANLLLVQNIFTKQQVLGPLWSLPYELQMYVVLPGLYLLARGKRALATLGSLQVFFWVVGFVVFGLTRHLNMAAYVPCFLSGVLCYALRNNMRQRFPAWLWPPFLVAAFGVLLSVNQNNDEPTFWSGWMFCLELALALNAFKDSRVRPINVVAEKMALYSYGIYLLHVPILYLVFVHLGIRRALAGSALFLVLTLLASVAGFHAIESPLMEVGRRLSSNRRQRRPGELASEAPVP